MFGLVYVAAFVTEEAVRLPDTVGASKDAVLSSGLVPFHYPAANGELAMEVAIDPARFYEILAADLPAEEAAVMAVIQRPVAGLAFSGPAGPPAWRRLPSWAVVATGDKTAGTDFTGSTGQRASSTITEGDSSHGIIGSQLHAVEYSHRVFEGIGHNVPQEASGALTDAILEVGDGLP